MQSMDLAALLRRLPHSLQRCREVTFALEAHQAMTHSSSLAFLKLHSRGTWMQQAIMLTRLQQVRLSSTARLPGACLKEAAGSKTGLKLIGCKRSAP
jgi:hypothetical protein